MDESKTPPWVAGPQATIFLWNPCLQKQSDGPISHGPTEEITCQLTDAIRSGGCSSGTGLATGPQDHPMDRSPGALLGTWET